MMRIGSAHNAQLLRAACLKTQSQTLIKVLCPQAPQQKALRRYATDEGSQGSGSTSIAPPNVRELAKMAHISVTDQEVAEWEPKIQEIVGWFDQLQQIDTEGVEPCTRSSLAEMLAAGKDEPKDFQNRDGLLEGVPDMEGPYVKVPKIM